MIIFRKPDLVVDPKNMKVREPSTAANDNLDNRFSETSGSSLSQHRKCGLQTFMQRIVGGEICEIDEFPWAALLLYESSRDLSLFGILNKLSRRSSFTETTNVTQSACGAVLLNKRYVLTAGKTLDIHFSTT